MLVIDPPRIRRKYYITDPNTVYTLRGVYVPPTSRPIVMGDFCTDPKAINAPTKLVTH